MQIGYLGLPRILPDDLPAMARGDVLGLKLVLSKAASNSAIGQEITNQLGSDPRVAALDGRLVGTGTNRHLFALGDLVAWYLWRANEIGIEAAAADLDRYLNDENIETLQALWVYGVEVPNTVSVIPGVSLIPAREMPISIEREQFINSRFAFPPPPIQMPVAALTCRVRIPKASSDQPTKRLDALWQAQRELRELSLVLNCFGRTKCLGAFSSSYCPPDVPLGFLGGSGGGSPLYDVIPAAPEGFVPREDGLEARVFSAFKQLPEKPKTRLSNALRRMAQAKSRLNYSEFALDLGIALEMVLLGGTHKRGVPAQLSVQFKLRGSWLAGSNGKDRKAIYSTLGKIYTTRSEVAHSGTSHTFDKMKDADRVALADSYLSVAERIFVRLIEGGFPEDWDDLLLRANES